MNGTDDHLSAEERYALEAAEAALSSGGKASNHAELGALSRLLIRTTPQADAAFAHTLEGRLIGQHRAAHNQLDVPSGAVLLEQDTPLSESASVPEKRPWMLSDWLGRGLRRGLDAAITLALLGIFFVAFLWPSIRPARRETTFYYHMPEGLTHDELYGKADPPQPVVIDGQTLWRSLTLAEVQTLVDYPVLAPTILNDVRFRGASYDHSTGAVVANYMHPDANQTFTLVQQPVGADIDDTEKLPIGPETRGDINDTVNAIADEEIKSALAKERDKLVEFANKG